MEWIMHSSKIFKRGNSTGLKNKDFDRELAALKTSKYCKEYIIQFYGLSQDYLKESIIGEMLVNRLVVCEMIVNRLVVCEMIVSEQYVYKLEIALYMETNYRSRKFARLVCDDILARDELFD
ncbi:hypothetical protein C2G38_2028509 [Gigaspora rosea]|uniref:Uncharacterized protein n=1 Tax=Gigaspora rosea TaxID=44941 RepID=A0A397W167_9GLOM|nr:hypothetical protein C2G38_2028509 [Gigaspora rosea]